MTCGIGLGPIIPPAPQGLTQCLPHIKYLIFVYWMDGWMDVQMNGQTGKGIPWAKLSVVCDSPKQL